VTSAENNADDWREIRARADSVASVVFLIAGGALSLSISVLLQNQDKSFITPHVEQLAATSWWFLFAAVVLFVLLKVHMVFQAYLLQFHPSFNDRHIGKLNGLGWSLGLSGLSAFVVGMALMVQAAVVATTA
jgi:hypothetical protein